MNRKKFDKSRLLQGDISITKHVIERYKERLKLIISDKNVIKKITNEVQRSRLIKIRGNEEQRMYKEWIYVTKRQFKNGVPEIIVITLLLTVKNQITLSTPNITKSINNKNGYIGGKNKAV